MPRKIHTRLVQLRRILLGKYLWITRIAVLLLTLGLLSLIGIALYRYVAGTQVGYYASLGKNFLFPSTENVKVINGRTNILILGKGGENHEAPDLTDTMIFASITHKEPHKIDLISLPRDIWIPHLEDKLNSVYYWGKQQQNNGGMVFAKSTVEEILGQPVHYAIVFDFKGFREVIELLGGVEVNVEKSFTDERFPIPGKENDLCDGDPQYLCRYETVTFERGPQHMDGETALKFVRSRHSEDLEEGTDIARSKRQQKVINAVVNKLTSRETLTSISTLRELMALSDKYVETDLDDTGMATLARRAYQAKSTIESHGIPEEMLFNPPYIPEYKNLYVFIPAAGVGNWSQIQEWLKDIL